MRGYRFLVVPLLLAIGMAPGDAGTEEGWIALFDGRTLDGWAQRNGTAEYRAENGAIVGRTSEGSPNSFLTTEQTYGDFELEFEVKVDDALNSGVQIRSGTKQRATGEGPDDRVGRVFGPQVEIEASPGLAGYVYGEATGRGWLTPKERLVPHAQFRNGEWNRYRIVARGPRIQTWLNGQPIEDLTDEAAYEAHPEGFIGMQVHGIEPGTGPYEVAWRKLRLRPLPAG
jgi:3-keto-disaccharide hydrolase